MRQVLRATVSGSLAAAISRLRVRPQSPAAWSGAKPVPSSRRIRCLPANVIYQMVQKRTGGKIVSQALCEVGGHFVYKLVVLGPKGDGHQRHR